MARRIFFSLLLALTGFASFAQAETVSRTFWDDPFGHPMLPIYAVTTLVFLVALLVVVVGIYLIRVFNMLTMQVEKEKAIKSGMVYKPKPTWWNRLMQQMNAAVPVEQEGSIELDHNYDGIKELDNHLPPWWKWLFYGTIGWSAIYLVVFHVFNSLPLSGDEYRHEVAVAEEQARKLRASQPVAQIDENTLVFTPDSTSFIEKGKVVFADNNCGSCHRADGGGNTIGPNLTDPYWLHGGDVKNVFATIKNGVVEKGMPAWGKGLTPEQVRNVTFFVMSLQGTNPANPKAPQGDLYKEPAVAQDSTKAQASL